MIGLEERVAFLEGRAVEQSNVFAGVRDSMKSLERNVERLELRFDGLERRFDGLELRFDGLERRFDGLELRFDGLERRFDGLELRFDGLERRFDGFESRFEGLERRFDGFERSVSGRFDAMDAKMSRQFTWLSGMLLTGLLGMVGALIAR